MLRAAPTAMLLLLGCHAAGPALPEEPFSLCGSVDGVHSTVRIEFSAMRGFVGDVGRPISLCRGSDRACMDFPFVFSEPPRLPRSDSDIVRWRIGNHSFSMSLRPNSTDIFIIELITSPGGNGRSHTSAWRSFYTYHSTDGILALRVEGSPTRSFRCGGRFTFDALRALKRVSARQPN